MQKLLRLHEVRMRVPYSRATIYRKMSLGEFPRSCSLGARAVAWVADEINAWIASRLEQRDGSGTVV
jgi:prophage regulatory protein